MQSDDTVVPAATRLSFVALFLALFAFAIGCKSGPTAAEYVRDAKEALANKRYDEARTYTNLAEKKGSTDREIRVLRAKIERKLAERELEDGDTEEAFEHFVEAGDYDPRRIDTAEVYVRAVELGRKSGMAPDKLAPIAQKAVDANPSFSKAHRLAAQTWDEAGRPEKALASYLWLWQSDHSKTKIGRRLASIYQALDRPDEAITILQQVLQVEEDNAQAALKIAQLYAKTGEPGRAREIFEELVDRYPKKPGILLRYARFLEKRGESGRARALKKRAYEQMPGVKKRKMRELQ